jgi:hypothetical protein
MLPPSPKRELDGTRTLLLCMVAVAQSGSVRGG